MIIAPAIYLKLFIELFSTTIIKTKQHQGSLGLDMTLMSALTARLSGISLQKLTFISQLPGTPVGIYQKLVYI